MSGKAIINSFKMRQSTGIVLHKLAGNCI